MSLTATLTSSWHPSSVIVLSLLKAVQEIRQDEKRITHLNKMLLAAEEQLVCCVWTYVYH